MSFDPTIAGLVKMADDDWGDRDENLEHALWFRIPPIDNALYGINIKKGEMVGIQADRKNRKSTLLLNFVVGFASQLKKKGHPWWICCDTLESGMPPSAYRDSLIAIVATRLYVAQYYGNDPAKWPRVEDLRADDAHNKAMVISREFFEYGRRTEIQHGVINRSKNALSQLPISIFGGAASMGSASNAEITIQRWSDLYHGRYIHKNKNGEDIDMRGQEYRIFTCDHISRGSADHYTKQESVVSLQGEFLITHPGAVVISVAQIGTGALDKERMGYGKAHAKGGTALAAEATILFRTRYDEVNDPHHIGISVDNTRRKPPPPVMQDIDLESGAFLQPGRKIIKGTT